MTNLDADAILGGLGEFASHRIEEFETFAEIESTNSYLLQQPAPSPGRVRVALTDNQTAGRGRHGRTWQSPPGSGLCLSMGYTFARQPSNLPALTLAIGLGVTEALSEVGVHGVLLKWPNDLMADDGKLGGILTETLPLAEDRNAADLLEIAADLMALSGKARAGKLAPGDMQGGCISISSLGGIGGTGFTPIINAPEVAILGVSRSTMKPVWNGESFQPRLMLPLSLSYDHRVIDGAAAARFTRFLASRLEDLRRLTL